MWLLWPTRHRGLSHPGPDARLPTTHHLSRQSQWWKTLLWHLWGLRPLDGVLQWWSNFLGSCFHDPTFALAILCLESNSAQKTIVSLCGFPLVCLPPYKPKPFSHFKASICSLLSGNFTCLYCTEWLLGGKRFLSSLWKNLLVNVHSLYGGRGG